MHRETKIVKLNSTTVNKFANFLFNGCIRMMYNTIFVRE